MHWNTIAFWLVLGSLGLTYVAAMWALEMRPENRAEQRERQRLCSAAVLQVLAPGDLVSLERGKYLVEELRCDIVREALTSKSG